MDDRSETVRLLRMMNAGDEAATEELLARVYHELHDIASKLMADERRGHTLQPTALIHDAWMRLAGGGHPDFDDRRHFLRVSARAMRRILVDHARARRAVKRGGGQPSTPLDEAMEGLATEDHTLDLVALDEALESLGRNDPELLRVVELRFFAGLTLEETGEVLGMSAVQVHRAWSFARGWLRDEMGSGAD